MSGAHDAAGLLAPPPTVAAPVAAPVVVAVATNSNQPATSSEQPTDLTLHASSGHQPSDEPSTTSGLPAMPTIVEYRLYKRRWLVLAVVCLLNFSNAMVTRDDSKVALDSLGAFRLGSRSRRLHIKLASTSAGILPLSGFRLFLWL